MKKSAAAQYRKDYQNESDAILTASQSIVARSKLKWTTNELARRAGMTKIAVREFEDGTRRVQWGTLHSMRNAFEEAGISIEKLPKKTEALAKAIQLNERQTKISNLARDIENARTRADALKMNETAIALNTALDAMELDAKDHRQAAASASAESKSVRRTR
jgi:transcriptional regulator with XRE-family HTH domain